MTMHRQPMAERLPEAPAEPMYDDPARLLTEGPVRNESRPTIEPEHRAARESAPRRLCPICWSPECWLSEVLSEAST